MLAVLGLLAFAFFCWGISAIVCAAPFLLVVAGLYLVWRLLDLLFGGRRT